MWRANPISLLREEKKPIPDRRAIKRADVAIPLTIKLIGIAASPPPITVETANISPQGLSIVINLETRFEHGRLSIQGGEDSIRMAQYLLLDNRTLALGINILPQGRSIKAMGKVKWYNRSFSKGLYSVKAGILIEKIEREHKKEWLEFLAAIYRFLECLELKKG